MGDKMSNRLSARTSSKITMKPTDEKEMKRLHAELKQGASSIFGRSMAIREIDTGSDGSPEIELVNLTNPAYDIEQYGITFVASPRHADVLLVTGPVTCAMANPLRKAYESAPSPKWVIALGDDACGIGIFRESYAVIGSVDKVIPVDIKIPGNPPTPLRILRGLLDLIKKIEKEGAGKRARQ